jgi:hypothetical protein
MAQRLPLGGELLRKGRRAFSIHRLPGVRHIAQGRAKSRMRTASGRRRSTKHWIHSAPSLTAHTVLAVSVPLRYVESGSVCTTHSPAPVGAD